MLAVGVPLAVAGAAWVVRMPNIYRASAQILIEPPQFDPVLSTLLSTSVGHHDAEAAERYVPNRLAMLRSKPLAEEVVNDPAVAPPGGAAPDAADALVASLQARPVAGTSGYVTVTLEGPDPARAAKQLTLLLEAFQRRARDENLSRVDASKVYAQESFNKLNADHQKLNEKILDVLRTSETVGPGGKNIKQGQYEMYTAMLARKRERVGELQQQSILSQAAAGRMGIGDVSAREVQIEKLEEARATLTDKMQHLKRTARYFDTDPSARALAARLRPVMDKLTRLRSIPERAPAADPYEVMMEATRAEILADERAARALLAELQASMPEHQKFLDMLDQQKQMVGRIATMQTKLSDFEFVSRSMKNPVTIPPTVAEPSAPVRPKRALYLAAVLVLSFGLGIGLVCLLEHVDHSVKMPEQLTAGLALPLFGVVPRMRRHRGLAPRRAPLDAGRARVDRGRRLPQPPRQPAGGRRPSRADRDPAGHQRQGGRGQEHHGAEPGRHLRPRRRAHAADGRRPPPPQPGRRLPRGRRRREAQARLGRRPPRRAPLAAHRRADRHPRARLPADRRHPRRADRGARHARSCGNC